MGKAIDIIVGKTLIGIGVLGTVAGIILIYDNPQNAIAYTETLASIGAWTGGYKFFLKPNL